MNHTPGPWEINLESLNDLQPGCISIDSRNHGALALVVWVVDGYPDSKLSKTCQANARLIAAAPDLLKAATKLAAALKDIVNAADNRRPYVRDELCGPAFATAVDAISVIDELNTIG